MQNNLTFLTFSSPDFMKRANVCVNSIKKYYPNAEIILDKIDINCKVGTYIPNLSEYALNRTLELLESGREYVVRLGADCVLYDQMDAFEAKLKDSSILLIPHITKPLEDDGKVPNNASVYGSGHANADLVGFTQKSKDIIKWLLKQDLSYNPSHHIFYEQTWFSALPFLFDDVKILRDNSYNLAYYNAYQRKVTFSEIYYVDGNPLVMAQFSGYTCPERMSKYNQRADINGDLLKLFQEYGEMIK